LLVLKFYGLTTLVSFSGVFGLLRTIFVRGSFSKKSYLHVFTGYLIKFVVFLKLNLFWLNSCIYNKGWKMGKLVIRENVNGEQDRHLVEA